MRACWESVWKGYGPDQHWYHRDVEVEQLSFRIDLWAIDDDAHEWCCSINNGKRQSFVAKSPSRAMETCEVFLAANLRKAAKVCVNPTET